MIDEEIDRLSELVNIGAGHAAGAFSQLTGHTISMECPRVVRDDDADSVRRPGGKAADEAWSAGVIFEFDGCVSALVGILFRRSMRDAIVSKLLGGQPNTLPQESVDSILMEVGNILASHVASAIADTLGARLLPSIPTLVVEDAESTLDELAERRGNGIRIECELVDRLGDLGGLVVMIPDLEAIS